MRVMRIVALSILAGTCTVAHAREHRPLQIGQSARYVCADGRRIEVLYGGGDTVLTVGNQVTQLTRSPDSADELYVGGGWTWSVSGRQSGLLSSSTAPHRVACQVG